VAIINVLLEEPSSRARQAVQWVLGSMLGLDVQWADSVQALSGSEGLRLTYGERAVEGAFHVMSSGWLRATGTATFDPPMGVAPLTPLLFPASHGDMPFDIFAASFFQLSRYEEWTSLPADAHGRPHTDALHAARHGYLHRPVVDEWAWLLADRLKHFDPAFAFPERRYRQVVTVDLDNGFKYLGRPIWRTLGSAARDLLRGQWSELGERAAVLLGGQVDPFAIDSELQSSFAQAADRIAFFVLAGERGEWDHAVPVDHPLYATELRKLDLWADVGLHPSYASSTHEGLTAKEATLLQNVLQRPIAISRQHFLRLRMPGTFRELESLGIREEHSLGIHDRLGFRSGTCTPYPWYDLQQERATDLMVHPFTVMDNTLRDKLKLPPEQALDAVRPIIDSVKRVRGTFTGLWHESFLARTGPHALWRQAILSIIREARA
jgi:hypothetical protein